MQLDSRILDRLKSREFRLARESETRTFFRVDLQGTTEGTKVVDRPGH